MSQELSSIDWLHRIGEPVPDIQARRLGSLEELTRLFEG